MRSFLELLLVALAVAVAGCASKPTLRVSAERSSTADFAAYQTYRWASPPPEASLERPRTGRDLMDWRLRAAIENQLAAKGYTRVSSGRADLVVAAHIDLRDMNTETVGDYIDYRKSGGQEGPQEAYVFGYQEGTIIVEVVEAATQHLVWRGAASPLIDPEGQPERLREAVQHMMARFPGH
jgi:hypothetical protein